MIAKDIDEILFRAHIKDAQVAAAISVRVCYELALTFLVRTDSNVAWEVRLMDAVFDLKRHGFSEKNIRETITQVHQKILDNKFESCIPHFDKKLIIEDCYFGRRK